MRRTILQIAGIVFILLFCILGWSLLLGALSERGVAQTDGALIRLHVLANSDDPADQRRKLLVRDAVLTALAPKLEGVTERAEARRIISESRAELTDCARRTLAAAGSYAPVRLELGTFDFPVKAYGDIVVPPGRYEALRVLIGDAEGANWWCVLFPPLCFIDESTVTRAADGEADEKTGELRRNLEFRLKIAELLKAL